MTQCSDEVKKIVLEQGNTYFAKNIEIAGKDYYGFYIPIEDKGNIIGMIFTKACFSTELAMLCAPYASSSMVVLRSFTACAQLPRELSTCVTAKPEEDLPS